MIKERSSSVKLPTFHVTNLFHILGINMRNLSNFYIRIVFSLL